MCALGGSKAHDGGIYAVSMGLCSVASSVVVVGPVCIRRTDLQLEATESGDGPELRGHVHRMTWPGHSSRPCPDLPPTLVLLLPARKWGLWPGCFLRPLPTEI